MLKQGSKGPPVVALQTFLTSIGFNPGPIDGNFQTGTRSAVVNFQASKGLTPDGTVGPLTWGILCDIISPNQAPQPCPPSINFPFQSFGEGPWKFSFGFIDNEGLLMQNIVAGKQRVLDTWSVPHFKIAFKDGTSEVIRFCSTDSHSNPTVIPGLVGGQKKIVWHFIKDLGFGKLTVFYEIIIGTTQVNNCEMGHNKCFRFIPMVKFHWDSNDKQLDEFTAFYRLDYGNQVGLTLVKDLNAIPAPGGFQNFVTHERIFEGLKNGMEGKIDNIHTAHIGDSVFIPGCRFGTQFDCYHMHWRWGDTPSCLIACVDPMVEPSKDNIHFPNSLRGKPYLVEGQTITGVVLKFNTNEPQDPDNPLSGTFLNGESLAVSKQPACLGCAIELVSASHPLVWYIASTHTNDMTFFRHGTFVLDTS
jgi:hypothetical protein